MREMNARGIGVMRRICKRCGASLTFEYRRGRPREHCFECQPPGTRMIGAVKLMDGSPDTSGARKFEGALMTWRGDVNVTGWCLMGSTWIEGRISVYPFQRALYPVLLAPPTNNP